MLDKDKLLYYIDKEIAGMSLCLWENIQNKEVYEYGIGLMNYIKDKINNGDFDDVEDKIIAVSCSDYKKYGCVKCGCEYAYSGKFSVGGCTTVTCGECKEVFLVLADGLDKSKIGVGTPAIYQVHPRTGIPKHKYIRPDIRPENDGEYWSPRDIGYNLSGFVKSKEAGERIVKMVDKIIEKTPKTWLDYREHEPDWIQVKVQSEDGFDLEKLYNLCKEDKIITEEKLRSSMVN